MPLSHDAMLTIAYSPTSDAVPSHDAPAADPGTRTDDPVPSDGDLLRSFLAQRDESAFSQLVERFGPLVLATAVRAVRDRQMVEDVFQSTFLVLARDARTVRQPDAVGAWLHAVAVRIARRAARRRRTESLEFATPRASDSEPFDDLHRREQQQLVDEELGRLPPAWRAAVVLHLLEGKSCEETAAALGISVGAVRGRLQRGRHELKLRLLRRGVELSAVLAAIGGGPSSASAAVSTLLTGSTIEAGMAVIRGTAWPPSCSPEAIHLAQQGTTMWTIGNVAIVSGLMLSSAGLGWASQSLMESPAPAVPLSVSAVFGNLAEQSEVRRDADSERDLAVDWPLIAFDDKPAAGGQPQLTLKYDDGKADGKRSIAGAGQMIRFSLPDKTQKLRNLRIHCARYGQIQPPQEDVEVTIVSDDGTDIVHTEFVPYSTFKRGESQWTTIRFKEEVVVPETFWVILQFNAEQTKGVYVSFDTSSGGQHSKTGVPGGESQPVNFGGDWMIQAILTAPEKLSSDG